MCCLGNWVDRLVGMGLFSNCEACKESVEYVLFECTSYNSKDKFLYRDYLKEVLLNAFEDFIHCNIFDNAVFCLGEKQD